MNSHIVSMCNYKIGNSADILSTHFLGSCIAIVLYDKNSKIGGLSHSLLPSYSDGDEDDVVLKRYVDKIIPILINEMVSLGANKNSLKAMLFGGSKMDVLKDFDLKIGENNVSKSREMLAKYDIPVVEEDIGGKYARSISFDCSTGKIVLKKAFSNSSQDFAF